MLETELYALLSSDDTINNLVGDRINPSQPPKNQSLAYLTYTCQSSELASTLDGPQALEKASVIIDLWCLNSKPLYDLCAAVKSLLSGYRGDNFKYIRLDSHSTDHQQEGYHGQQVYSVNWVDTATLSTIGELAIGSTVNVYLNSLTDDNTEDPVNNATVTFRLYQPDEATLICTATGTYRSGSNGGYLGVIPNATTSTLTEGTDYRLKGTATTGSATLVLWLTLTAV